jgi:PAS domain S-box-containing protein
MPGTQAGRPPDGIARERRRRFHPEYVIPAVYAVLAAAWVLGSDALVALGAEGNAHLFARLSTVKGWAFVLATAVLLHVLLRRVLARERALARGEEEQREEALRTRTLLLQVLDATPMPVYVTTGEGRFALVNRAWEQITRVPRSEALGRPVSEVLPEVSTALATARRVVERGETARELEQITFGGVRQVYDTLRFPLRGPDGQVFAVGGLSIDVTAQHEAQAALRAERAFLQTVLDHAGVLVGVVDRDGRLVRLNRHFERVTGKKLSELEGTLLWDTLLPPDEAEGVARTFKEVWGGEFPVVFTNDVATKDGGRRTIEWTDTLIPGPDGAPALLVGIGHDVTERTQAEARQRESREQLRALAARIQGAREEEKARIARDLHDELGQLLTGLKMDLRWLERRVGELPPSPETHALLDRAVAASALADQTSRTVQRLAAELRPGALDRLGLEAALRQEARRFEERTGIPCEVALGDAGTALGSDGATTLYRIAQEAMTNVARHAGAQRVKLALERAGGDVVLRVEDDGRGLPSGAEVRPDALGLLGMKERAAMLGGEVRLEPRSGGGTVVLARLPAAPGGSA